MTLAHLEVMLPLLRRALYDFRTDSCDLIVSMEQAEISPRPVVGAILVVSGLAVSFLLWLLYVHHASVDFAGRWMFLPALNALLNGLCAIALCVDCISSNIITGKRIARVCCSHSRFLPFF